MLQVCVGSLKSQTWRRALNNSSNEQLSYFHDFSQKSLFLTPGMTEAFHAVSPGISADGSSTLTCTSTITREGKGGAVTCALSLMKLLLKGTCTAV